MKRTPEPQSLSFQSKLERIADDMEYYALPVPAEITRTLGTHAAVPVSAQINESTPFLVSLYPIGGGRHYMRIKAKVRAEVNVTGGDRVRVKITVIDRAAVVLPPDLIAALKAEGVLEAFKTVTPGKQNYAIRLINAAVKPETRVKKIKDAVELAKGAAKR